MQGPLVLLAVGLMAVICEYRFQDLGLGQLKGRQDRSTNNQGASKGLNFTQCLFQSQADVRNDAREVVNREIDTTRGQRRGEKKKKTQKRSWKLHPPVR